MQTKPTMPDLQPLTGMDNVADAETEAQIMVNDYEQAHDTTDLWKKSQCREQSNTFKVIRMWHDE